jgi:hypothetical protein
VGRFGAAAPRQFNQPQRLNQPGQQLAQFALVIGREDAQHALALRRQREPHAAAIRGVMRALQQARFFASIAEFDNAVVAQAQPLGCVRDGGFHALGSSGNLQQKLMLLGLEAGLLGALLAKQQKLAKRVAEVGQRA